MQWATQVSLICQGEDTGGECHAFSEPRITKKAAREAAASTGWRFAEGRAYCPACWRELRLRLRAERAEQ